MATRRKIKRLRGRVLALHNSLQMPLEELSALAGDCWKALTAAVDNTLGEATPHGSKRGGRRRIRNSQLLVPCNTTMKARLEKCANAVSNNLATLENLVEVLADLEAIVDASEVADSRYFNRLYCTLLNAHCTLGLALASALPRDDDGTSAASLPSLRQLRSRNKK